MDQRHHFLETDEVGLTFWDLGADGKLIIFNIELFLDSWSLVGRRTVLSSGLSSSGFCSPLPHFSLGRSYCRLYFAELSEAALKIRFTKRIACSLFR